jgi:hypothetical protein
MNIQNKNLPFHPSIFESTQQDTPLDEKILLESHDQRKNALKDLTKFKSPGRYRFTISDDDVASSNTRYLFKNLYGDTLLTDMFFSKTNIENIQNVIQYLVFKNSNYVIDKQSYNELMIIMRSVFLEYSNHPTLLTDDMSHQETQLLLQKYKNEVTRLNEIVFNAIVPKIISQLQQYIDYLRDASQQPQQLERSKNESIKGQKQYRSITQVLTGNVL